MALTMFGDLSAMVGIQGVGVRLGGRVCNTMKAFSLSEQGIKPGMTWLSSETEQKMLSLVRKWKNILGSWEELGGGTGGFCRDSR